MRRQESTQVEGKSAGRNEAEMRSETQQVHRQRFSHPKSLLRYAPAEWWPWVETALRTGCIKTRGHPFQGYIRYLCGFDWTYAVALTQRDLTHFCE